MCNYSSNPEKVSPLSLSPLQAWVDVWEAQCPKTASHLVLKGELGPQLGAQGMQPWGVHEEALLQMCRCLGKWLETVPVQLLCKEISFPESSSVGGICYYVLRNK